MTTIHSLRDSAPSVSRLVAAEVRAELGRQGINQTELARRMGVSQVWLSIRINPRATVDLKLDEVAHMAEALGITPERLLAGWLPRLDSNQQPSVYPYPQVSAVVVSLEEYRATGRVTPYPRPLEDDEERAS